MHVQRAVVVDLAVTGKGVARRILSTVAVVVVRVVVEAVAPALKQSSTATLQHAAEKISTKYWHVLQHRSNSSNYSHVKKAP